MTDLARLLDEVGREYAPDPRTSVFEVAVEAGALTGHTTSSAAIDALLALVADEGEELRDEVVRLPDPLLRDRAHALVSSAYVPVHDRAAVASTQVTQYVMGARVDVLTMRDGWLRIRGEDGYIGWVHPGYLELGDEDWAQRWETASEGEPLVSLDADLHDEAGRTIARLPWGARVIRDQPRSVLLPDGRRGTIGRGEVVSLARRAERFPARGDSVVRSAREWLGVPYLWGGVTQAGVDCSGLVQSLLWMHGIAVPRDSDLQIRVGQSLEAAFEEFVPGDLAFFAEHGDRITHVALSMGGSQLIHCALANGEVAVNDLRGGAEIERQLAGRFVGARRVLPS